MRARLWLLLLPIVSLPAQDTAHVGAARRLAAANRIDVDSLLVEGCRGGRYTAANACVGSTLAPRATVVRRLSLRVKRRTASLDSIEAKATPVCLALVNGRDVPTACGSVPNVGWSVTPLYNSSRYGFADTDAADSVSVCARVVRGDGRVFVGYPALRIRTVVDSVGFGVRGGNPLQAMCGPAFTKARHAWPTDSIAVTWAGAWLTLPLNGMARPVWRPVASLPIP